jgi:hypothetical protein
VIINCLKGLVIFKISDPASLAITSVATDCAFHPQNVVTAITTVGTNQMKPVAAVWPVIFRNLSVPMVKSALQSFKSVTTGRSARMAQMKRIAVSFCYPTGELLLAI